MKARITGVFVAVALCAWTWADEPTSPPPAKTPAPVVVAAPELCKGVIDPYDPGAERARFFKADGDGSLNDEERRNMFREEIRSFIQPMRVQTSE